MVLRKSRIKYVSFNLQKEREETLRNKQFIPRGNRRSSSTCTGKPQPLHSSPLRIFTLKIPPRFSPVSAFLSVLGEGQVRALNVTGKRGNNWGGGGCISFRHQYSTKQTKEIYPNSPVPIVVPVNPKHFKLMGIMAM